MFLRGRVVFEHLANKMTFFWGGGDPLTSRYFTDVSTCDTLSPLTKDTGNTWGTPCGVFTREGNADS